uniref:Uncharacterized protein n=1 Tax=Strigamia maritima TaxID=126957 RepID=T1IPC7_STRMM
MDYPYLNQTGFESSCSLSGMDPSLSNCNLQCSYGDLASCGQVTQAYRYTSAMRSFPGTPAAAMAGGNCAVMSRPRDAPHHQAPVFPATMNLQ